MVVRFISSQKGAALVEWVDDGELKRGIVPLNVVNGDEVALRELNRAIEYGEPWEELKLEADSAVLARELRKVGIWTLDDLRSNPRKALVALMAMYNVDYHSLLKQVYEMKKSQEVTYDN